MVIHAKEHMWTYLALPSAWLLISQDVILIDDHAVFPDVSPC